MVESGFQEQMSVGYVHSNYSPPEVDRIWGIWHLIVIYPKPYSIYFEGTIPMSRVLRREGQPSF